MVVEKVRSAKQLLEYIATMNREKSVYQFIIPGKGKFTLVFQEEDEQSISDDVKANPELKNMINESREQYKQGLGISTNEFLKSMTPKDFVE
jgi:hypothetical protein